MNLKFVSKWKNGILNAEIKYLGISMNMLELIPTSLVTVLCPVAPLRGFPGILVYGFPFLPFVLKCNVRYTRGSCVPHPSLASVLACVEYLV